MSREGICSIRFKVLHVQVVCKHMELFRWSLLKILHQRRWKDRWHSQHGYAAVIRFGNTNKIWSMTGVYPLSRLEPHLFSSHSPKISKGRSTSSTPTLLVLHSEMRWSAWCRHDYVQLFRRPGCSYVNDRFAFSLEVERTEGVKSMQLNLNAHFLAYPYPYLPLLMIVKG